MRTVDGVFNEFAAALQFPWYFGRNWDAFDECLSDLGWIEFASFVLVVFDADQVLVEDPVDMVALVRGVVGAYEEFSLPVENGEWWDRPAKPFHVVLDAWCQEGERWSDALAQVRRDPGGARVSSEGTSLERLAITDL